jgi:competence protein ComEC
MASAEQGHQPFMIRACLLMLAGGVAAQHSRVPLSSDLCKLILVAAIVLLAIRRTRAAGCVLLGFALFVAAGQGIVENRLEEHFAGDSLLTRVRIVDFPTKSGATVIMLIEPVNDARLPRRSRVSWYEPRVAPSIGDLWELELRLKRPRGLSNPGVFDVEAWLFREKVGASGYVVNGKRNRLVETGTESTIDALRGRFVTRAAKAASSREASGVLAAVGVGARHQISGEQWRKFALSGTSHLMAISGLHVGLAATAAFLLGRIFVSALRPGANAHSAAVVVSVFAAIAYVAVSGIGVPALRATLMLIIAGCAILRRRNIDPLATIAVAAIVVFVVDPVALMTPGFSLSFCAVLLLVWISRHGKQAMHGRGLWARVVNRLRQLIVIQLTLLFGLMPLTVALFDRIALLAMPVNLVAVPLFSLVTVPFTLLGLLLGDNFGQTGHVALKAAAASIEWLLALISEAVRLPFADTTVTALQGPVRLLTILPVLVVLLPKGWPGRYVALLSVAALLVHSPRTPEKGCLDLHILDVGQGLAAVAQTHGRVLLFDTGASYRSGSSVAEHVIVPFLKYRGINRIDWLLVSHDDIDHSGGVSAIVDAVDVDELLVGEALSEKRIASTRCLRGQRWQADGVRFSVLHPDGATDWQGNDASCVLLVEVGRHALLLTGDIEAGAESSLVEANPRGKFEAVIVPHHGSRTSSSVPFVRATSPRIAIVSAGFGNRWGFPRAAVVQRWQAVGAEVLNTATAGAVSLRLCADHGIVSLRRDRQERRRFWRADPH